MGQTLRSYFTLLLKIRLSACSVDKLFFPPDIIDVEVSPISARFETQNSHFKQRLSPALFLGIDSTSSQLFYHLIGNAKQICELLA